MGTNSISEKILPMTLVAIIRDAYTAYISEYFILQKSQVSVTLTGHKLLH